MAYVGDGEYPSTANWREYVVLVVLRTTIVGWNKHMLLAPSGHGSPTLIKGSAKVDCLPARYYLLPLLAAEIQAHNDTAGTRKHPHGSCGARN